MSYIGFYNHNLSRCILNAPKHSDTWNSLMIKRGKKKAESLIPYNVPLDLLKDSWRRGNRCDRMGAYISTSHFSSHPVLQFPALVKFWVLRAALFFVMHMCQWLPDPISPLSAGINFLNASSILNLGISHFKYTKLDCPPPHTCFCDFPHLRKWQDHSSNSLS